jgi:hypothetical protein
MSSDQRTTSPSSTAVFAAQEAEGAGWGGRGRSVPISPQAARSNGLSPLGPVLLFLLTVGGCEVPPGANPIPQATDASERIENFRDALVSAELGHQPIELVQIADDGIAHVGQAGLLDPRRSWVFVSPQGSSVCSHLGFALRRLVSHSSEAQAGPRPALLVALPASDLTAAVGWLRAERINGLVALAPDDLHPVSHGIREVVVASPSATGREWDVQTFVDGLQLYESLNR